MNEIILRNVEDKDIELIRSWLEKEHVKKWYHDADEWINEIEHRTTEFSFVHHKIAMMGDRTIGFCQYYDCYFAGEDWYTVKEMNDLFSIDYLIGEEEFLHKGIGTLLVKALTDEIKEKEKLTKIVVKPEDDNMASRNTLKSAGYKYEDKLEYFYMEIE